MSILKRRQRKRDENTDVYELQDLTVHEVSIVDHPAIGREFLVAKNLEEDEMEPTTTEPVTETPPSEEATKNEEAVVTPEVTPVAPALDLSAAIAFVTEHKADLGPTARLGAEMLERHKAEASDVAKAVSFDEAYRRMAAPGQVWAAMDSLNTCVWDVIYDDGIENKLDTVDAICDEFKGVLRGILGDAGVKNAGAVAATKEAPAEPKASRVKIGDQEVNASLTEFEAGVLEALHAIGEQVKDVSTRVGELEAHTGGEAEAASKATNSEPAPEEEKPLTASEALKLFRQELAKASTPRYRSTAVNSDDVNVDKVEREEGAPIEPKARVLPGEVAREGLLSKRR